jgi:hypothetical protein
MGDETSSFSRGRMNLDGSKRFTDATKFGSGLNELGDSYDKMRKE